MPTLDWIGKQAVVKHHEEVPDLCVGDPGSGNLLVQGDNLLALKALLPYYAGQVKCIYIDPPYNTGNENWVYNDAVNSPEIAAWLGRVVGGESEDLSRHDKWLCMMYPRLVLLKQFLRDDGVIFVSIDDNEVASLKLLLDDIYGRTNFVGEIVWRNVTDNNPTNISIEHEYILCYAKSKVQLEPIWKSSAMPIKDELIRLADELIANYPDKDERQKAFTEWFRANKIYMWPFDRYKYIDDGGIYTGSQSVHNPGKEGYRYDVIHPETGKPCRQPLMGYRFPEDTMRQLLKDDRVLFGEDESKIIELKLYVQDYKAKLPSMIELDTRLGANELRAIFPEEKRVFGFSKPSELIADLLSFATGKDHLVLDSFSGSGTTGHAVLRLNKQDGGARRFILVEMEAAIARDITAERLRRVIAGYGDKPGLGGGFRYCTLGEPLFDGAGEIRPEVSFADLARHVFFVETGEPLPRDGACASPLLGVARDTAVYLLYNGILRDTTPEAGNVLTPGVLAALPTHAGPKVVYGTGCLLSEARLREEGVTFKQIPYAIATR